MFNTNPKKPSGKGFTISINAPRERLKYDARKRFFADKRKKQPRFRKGEENG